MKPLKRLFVLILICTSFATAQTQTATVTHNLSALTGTGFNGSFDLSQARRTRLLLQEPQELMIDGEFYPDVMSIDIRILPRALACNRRTGAR